MVATNVNRDMNAFRQQFAQGKASEKAIKKFLLELGYKVSNPSLEEDKYQDIDCWIGTVPVSIKTQHASVEFALRTGRPRTAHFELKQHLTETQEWVDEGWFYTGKADKYIIRQANELMLVDKLALVEYVLENSWDFQRSLTWQKQRYLGGTYRYDNAICGYLQITKLPIEKIWYLPEYSAVAA